MIFVFIAASCLLIGGIEVMTRRVPSMVPYARRLTHVGAAFIAILAPYYVSATVIMGTCLAFAVIMVFLRLNALLPSVHAVERRSWGDVFFPLGEAVTAYLFLPHSIGAFQFGIAVLGISDVAAGIVGERWGRRVLKIFGERKTLEGSSAFFLATLAIGIACGVPVSVTLVAISGFLAALEMILVFGVDNLIIPIVAASLFGFL